METLHLHALYTVTPVQIYSANSVACGFPICWSHDMKATGDGGACYRELEIIILLLPYNTYLLFPSAGLWRMKYLTIIT